MNVWIAWVRPAYDDATDVAGVFAERPTVEQLADTLFDYVDEEPTLYEYWEDDSGLLTVWAKGTGSAWVRPAAREVFDNRDDS